MAGIPLRAQTVYKHIVPKLGPPKFQTRSPWNPEVPYANQGPASKRVRKPSWRPPSTVAGPVSGVGKQEGYYEKCTKVEE